MMIRLGGLLAAVLLSAVFASSAHAADVQRTVAGVLANGERVEAVTLSNHAGLSARVLTYGATLQSVLAPDRTGRLADVVLGYDAPADYQAHPNYFGATIGRYANRIAGGRFVLDGRTYQLPLNDKTSSLHGGGAGFDKRLWRIASTESGPKAQVRLELVSPDGDLGYPGRLEVSVTYALDEAGALTIAFEARTDKPTVLNLTNHAIFNLDGEGARAGALDHRLTIAATRFTPVDSHLIPTGEMRPVAGTPFDFRRPRPMADGIRDGRDPQIVFGRGYDHNFVLDKGVTAAPEFAARLESPSGRVLEVFTTEPGLQLYSGNFLDGTLVGKGGHLYRMGDGVALEPQKFPDAPNKPAFVSARVDPGRPYKHTMIYRFSVAP